MSCPRSIAAAPVMLLIAGCGILAPSPDPTPIAPTPGQPAPTSNCVDGAAPPEAPVYAFFTCADVPVPSDPRPVPRDAQAVDPEALLEAALAGLLSGPTAAEREAGYTSFFSEETALAFNSAVIEVDGTAIVDLGDIRFLNNASTSAGAGVLLSQLNATVFQFEEITAVEYRINGSCDVFWEWLQGGCQIVSRP